ncbi:myrosinase 1-like [Cylas formicarius]|uniref:myrosinase 1-like n=1 Tax=Cylas formicarius TaxID=197179 RepID=UPI00295858AB|nr:myrosinase 1-like [Cylas formicarius]
MKCSVILLTFTISYASGISNRSFPADFKFGVTTSAYQIEGGWNEDGKGDSLWDWYTHTYPDRIQDGTNADVACDSYHKYKEDIEILKDLGVNFYRLSIAWSRILPEGTVNHVNQAGVDYYRTVFQLLIDNGIVPVVTLYHWDVPLTLSQIGGWTNPLLVDYFADYARLAFELFGDQVKQWHTFNEPQSFCMLSYQGPQREAPGYDLPAEAVYQCNYVVLKAHAKAYHIYDDEFRPNQQGKISIVLVAHWKEPASDSDADKEGQNLALQFEMGLLANPIFNGNWPQAAIDRVAERSKLEGYYRSRLPEFTQEEIDYIKGTSDYFGFNHYSTELVTFAYNVTNVTKYPSFDADRGVLRTADPSWPQSNMTWLRSVPWGFRKMLNWIDQSYGHPAILVTENGWADDGTSREDPQRISYIQDYLGALLEAIHDDGVNVIGYSQWSIYDNFEWLSGYTAKFGLMYVDFSSPNRTRIPKSSYYYYQKIIKTKYLVDTCN